MQQPVPAQSSSNLSGFAGLLATLASPKPADDELLWSSSDLGEDVAALSYESALRTHARYRPADRRADRDRDDRNIDCGDGLPISSGRAGSGRAADTALGDAEADAAPSPLTETATGRNLRSASVTIRLSKAECARLHTRATEAGLTISAYLRSCVLEAEVLRAQVKQALAEMKAGSTNPGNKGTREQESKQPAPHGGNGVRLTRIFAHIGKLWLGISSGKSA